MVGVTDMKPWLKWSWVYGHLSVDSFDTLEDALAAAYYRQDDESLECFEGPDGVVSKDLYREYEREESARERNRRGPAATSGVRILGPDGKHWAWWETYSERRDAEAELERIRPIFGDRVKVVGVPLRVSDM
jgi:hypothetical protein